MATTTTTTTREPTPLEAAQAEWGRLLADPDATPAAVAAAKRAYDEARAEREARRGAGADRRNVPCYWGPDDGGCAGLFLTDTGARDHTGYDEIVEVNGERLTRRVKCEAGSLAHAARNAAKRWAR